MCQIKIYTKHQLEDTVFLKCDPEQLERIVTEIRVFIDGSYVYGLTQGTQTSIHQEAEINAEKDVLKGL